MILIQGKLITGGSDEPLEHKELQVPQASSSPASERAYVPNAIAVLVEDNRADVFLVRQAMESHQVPVDLVVLEDGEKAVKYFERAECDPTIPCPKLLLLDLNLPKVSGTEVLRLVRQAKRCQDIPVVVLTSSNSPDDRRETARLGATRYFRKPTSYHEFLKIGEVVHEVLKTAK